MNNQRMLIQIRSRKLGVLLYDSRSAARRTVEECAAAIDVTPDVYKSFESGTASPSLPQIELLAVYLNVPMEHFWGKQAISAAPPPQPPEEKNRMLQLRNRVIGASLRLARNNKGLSSADLESKTSIPEETLKKYELGEASIPLPELEVLCSTLDASLTALFDQHGPIGKWRAQQSSSQALLELTPELQQFVSKPINRPYLEIALRLSEMPADKLRTLAESLLEITF
jgi:transcriptional regulator with XRE-family HTH domain